MSHRVQHAKVRTSISYLLFKYVSMCCVIPTLLCCCTFCYRTALQELNFSDAPHVLVVQRWLSRCQSGLAACLRSRLSMTNFRHLRTRISAFSWRQTGCSRGWLGTPRTAPTVREVVITVQSWLCWVVWLSRSFFFTVPMCVWVTPQNKTWTISGAYLSFLLASQPLSQLPTTPLCLMPPAGCCAVSAG